MTIKQIVMIIIRATLENMIMVIAENMTMINIEETIIIMIVVIIIIIMMTMIIIMIMTGNKCFEIFSKLNFYDFKEILKNMHKVYNYYM